MKTVVRRSFRHRARNFSCRRQRTILDGRESASEVRAARYGHTHDDGTSSNRRDAGVSEGSTPPVIAEGGLGYPIVQGMDVTGLPVAA
jgi:hypothetical protein